MYNLHRATMTVDGEDKKILVPTNVLRTMKRNGLIKTFASRKTEK
jgi:ribosomal protein L28